MSYQNFRPKSSNMEYSAMCMKRELTVKDSIYEAMNALNDHISVCPKGKTIVSSEPSTRLTNEQMNELAARLRKRSGEIHRVVPRQRRK